MINTEEDEMKKRILKLLTVLLITITIFGCGNNVNKVRNKMEKYLYEKYGEEFVVDRIGRRSANGQEFYQARIYPKSIIGTNREDDDYYYASSSIDIKSFGRLGKPGDSYDIVMFNEGIENYIEPKAKEILGDRIRIISDSKYKKNIDGTFYWAFQHDFLKAKEIIETDKNYRIEVNLYVYIFDRIETEEEKGRRREEIFEFIQYLKEEGLFEYLEMGVIFIDERVLAPSYKNYKIDLKYGKKEKEIVDGEEVYLPQKELREEMSRKLIEELEKMNEEEKMENLKKLLKNELSYKGIGEFNSQYGTYIYSNKMLERSYPTSKRDKNIDYSKTKDITLGKGRDYIYGF